MSETEYRCNNCGALVKPTDTMCPKCGKNLSEVGRNIKKTFVEVIGLADSAQTITGSLEQGYAQLSGTFNVQQKRIANSFNFPENFETLRSIADTEKEQMKIMEEQMRLMEQQRKDALEDAKRQRRYFYVSTAIAVFALIIAILSKVL